MDNYGIDYQKLMFHPRRVADWLEGKNIYPLFMEIGPAARCMHRCVFCAFDYTKYKGALLSETYCKIVIEQASEMGLKSVMFAGEGEPLLNPSVIEMISYSKMHGVDVSMTTNGVKLNPKVALNALPFLEWLRFSVDAATPGTYAKVHGCRPEHFEKLVSNITTAVRIKGEQHSQCVIGVQVVLIPQNAGEIVELCQLAQSWGVDYFTVKPFSKHPSSVCDFDVDYSQFLASRESEIGTMEETLQYLATENFKVIFRSRAMAKLNEDRFYKECMALPFATYLSADGYVYPCSMFLGQLDFAYGNIYEECFPAIWEGKRRQEVVQRLKERGVESCREICRWDEVNRYLWQLKYEPPQHVNFI